MKATLLVLAAVLVGTAGALAAQDDNEDNGPTPVNLSEEAQEALIDHIEVALTERVTEAACGPPRTFVIESILSATQAIENDAMDNYLSLIHI